MITFVKQPNDSVTKTYLHKKCTNSHTATSGQLREAQLS